MAVLTKEMLLKASRKLKKISLDAGDIYIKALSANEVFDLKNKTSVEKPDEQTLYFLVSLSVCDKEGKTILEVEDVANLDIETINKIVIEIYEFNGLNPDAVAKAKEQLKNQTAPKDSI